VIEFVANGVDVDHSKGVQTPTGQISRYSELYKPKIRFGPRDGYVFTTEYWVQSGNRETLCHVDHGRNVAFIPPCCKQAFKVWVVYADPLGKHGKRCT
jgi:hypothetical protein